MKKILHSQFSQRNFEIRTRLSEHKEKTIKDRHDSHPVASQPFWKKIKRANAFDSQTTRKLRGI